jgi:hypothetical protein
VIFVIFVPRGVTRSGFAIGKEMLIDELVDRGLVGGIDLLELQAHPDPAIAPSHA